MKLRRVEIADGSTYGYRFDCPGCKAFADAKGDDEVMIADHVVRTEKTNENRP